MKLYIILLFIMALFVSKLNALETITDLKEVKAIINKAKTAEKEEKVKREALKKNLDEMQAPFRPISYELLYAESLPVHTECADCPKHLSLTGRVQQVLTQLREQDSSISMNEELQIKTENFNYQYFDASRKNSGSILQCKSDVSLDNGNAKPEEIPLLDTQLNLMVKDVFSFPSVQSASVFDPQAKQKVSYFRDNNLITEMRPNPKNGGVIIRYFKTDYIDPSVPEKTPEAPQLIHSNIPVETNTGQNGITFGFDIEKRYRDVHLMRAYGELPLSNDGVSVIGQSDTSLAKGNQAKIEVQDNGNNLVVVDLHTKLDGKTEHVITIPYSIRLPSPGVHFLGDAQTGTKEDVVHLRLSSDGQDYLQSEYRRTSAGNESWFVAHDLVPGSLSLKAGKEGERYISLQKKTSIGSRIKTVLTVKVEEGSGAIVTYQAEYPL